MDKQDETAQEAMQRIVDETKQKRDTSDPTNRNAARAARDRDQKRVPSDPDRDTSGDSVYKPEPRKVEPWETIHGDLDLRDPKGPDSPVTINGYQTVQVMPLSQYDAEKDLLIINVMVGKMSPDRARRVIHNMRQEMEPMLKELGWKHTMFVPVSYDHPMHRQFRTVNVIPGKGGCYQPTFDDLDENDPPRDT